MPASAPEALGRGVVVGAGDAVPDPWAAAPVVDVDAAALGDPASTVERLHEAWAGRQPVVVRLGVDAEAFRNPVSVATEPWRLRPDHEIFHDRLHFLVWANTYDARGGVEPIWWWARKALRRGGSQPAAGGAGEIVLPDGRPAWVDGGPRTWFEPETIGIGVALVHREAVEQGLLRADPPPRPVSASLAPDQLAAVSHGAGPARIIAPAGSGKTRVLTERLRHLLVDRRYEREAVLAVAYNKRAQLELEERTADFRPRATTLNALGHRLLADHAGRPPRVLDERGVRRLVDDLVPSRQRRANTDPIAPYLEGLSAIRLGLRDPREVEDERDDVPGLAGAFGPYREALRRAGAVDFDEQIYGAVEVLLADGEFRRRMQSRHRHLLVDELQDLTPAHVLLVRLLASPGLEVFGVGDDDQVIYGHAGADPAFLIGFDRLFPGAASHPLEVNYRCPVAVVDAARHLLGYNRRRVPKVIRPGPAADPDPEALIIRRHAPDAGARTLVEVVSGWLGGVDPAAPADVAVLTRVNSLLLAPHVALVEAGIPVWSTLSPDVLQRTGVRAALAYLRLGASPSKLDPDDLSEVLRRPSRGFPQWIGKWFSRPMSIEALRAVAGRIDDAKVGAKVEALADDLAMVADAVAGRTTREALKVIADDVGLAGAMALLDGSKGGQSGSQVDDLDALAQVADLHPSPATFEAWLRGILTRSAGVRSAGVGSASEQPAPAEGIRDEVAFAQRGGSSISPESNLVANSSGGERQGLGPEGGAAERGRKNSEGVTLSTVHRVKGMEWDRVAVAGVTAGVLPHRLAIEEVHGEEEERRVLHVAITRGRRRVVVLADASRPSPFLEELTGKAPARDPEAPRRRTDVTPIPKRDRQTRAATLGEPSSADVAAADAALRAWRLERARADKVAPFIIASNALVRAIAERRPTTAAELYAIHGMGPTKLDLYGDEILALLDGLD